MLTGDVIPVLEDFTASTETDGDGYETCVGLHGFGTVNQNSTKFLDLARSLDDSIIRVP